jgi:anthranilate synthase/aminodeoxychorismate synthase-like glutamine amidotransferase
MKHVLIIDNYDSFTYNISQTFALFGAKVSVHSNDRLSIAEAEKMNPTHLVISPGPGTPLNAGISNDAIRQFHSRIPILGVCLGHQCIAHVFGAKIEQAQRLMHGKTSQIFHDGHGVFSALPNPFPATRYHSLIVSENDFPVALQISARTSEREIMGLRIPDSKTEGVQFHPESYMTPEGTHLLENFLEM